MNTDPTVILTLLTLVKALAWGGSAGAIMWLASHYGDQWPWYVALDSWRQRVVMVVIAMLISFACYAAVTYLPNTFWDAAQPYFLIASAVAAPIFGGQLIYLLRRTPPVIADMNKIRSTGMIVPDDHPALAAMQARVQAEADANGGVVAAPVQTPPPAQP